MDLSRTHYGHRHMLNWAIQQLPNLNGARVLDVGVGEGQSTVLLAGAGAHVTGIDISGEALARASERSEKEDADDITNPRASLGGRRAGLAPLPDVAARGACVPRGPARWHQPHYVVDPGGDIRAGRRRRADRCDVVKYEVPRRIPASVFELNPSRRPRRDVWIG